MNEGDTDHPLQLRVDIESLFNDESLSDVQLVIEQGDHRQSFRCHKVILASMSTYFRSLFTGGMQESQQREIFLKGQHQPPRLSGSTRPPVLPSFGRRA